MRSFGLGLFLREQADGKARHGAGKAQNEQANTNSSQTDFDFHGSLQGKVSAGVRSILQLARRAKARQPRLKIEDTKLQIETAEDCSHSDLQFSLCNFQFSMISPCSSARD